MPMTPDNPMAERRNELLTDMMSAAERLLLEYEVAAQPAHLIASALADRLADQWGGQNITFPKDYRWKLSRLELQIYDEYKSHTAHTTALKYGLSERGLRKLIARVRKKMKSKNKNHDMFANPDAEALEPD